MLHFDHPLSERVRSLIRIEHLFNRFKHTLAGEDKWSHHVAIGSLFEIMECSSRADLKLEILQELERQRQIISRNQANNPVLDRLNQATQNLQEIQQKFGQHIRENEWLMALKQRFAVAGGTTPVELPSYYFWQKQAAEQRRQDLETWSQAMMPTYQATELLLEILRSHALTSECQANKGNYQHNSMAHNIHLLTIEIPMGENALPEVSANKYFTHIRFLSTDQNSMRGKQIERNIKFKMMMCSFDPIPNK
ncbi:MAG: cell division protein ZapD [Alysiella sp.]|uniref:cell division protein ZapD n=1 Tax=Alysiella sp. TaxID=1872483 RepID=UPI0026DD9C9F|nr:cell division protein ZapD [Alysiella sp.]MDO4433841.1 cell division protein ZapD [Alysiella sp.]